jgi:hypothetical protein
VGGFNPALKCLYLATRSLPGRTRQGTMGDEVEARAKRRRHHLRRPLYPERELTDTKIGSTR